MIGDIEDFIARNVTMREKSIFTEDIETHRAELERAICGKSMLVIGGAGSIGSAFIKACLPFGLKSLVVADVNENALAELTRDLRSGGYRVPEDYTAYPISYDDNAFEKMFRMRGKIDIVANFSAHKHVRSEKDIFSVEAMLQNNLLKTRRLLNLLNDVPPERFFCVSTDKAVNPVNIMGASKRIMEDMIFSCTNRFPVNTARFANVAFSNGSLPCGFLNRISFMQPISAPTDTRRYFVSPQESGQICMLACMLGKGNEVFFPKISEEKMMTFASIAKKLIERTGHTVLECKTDAEALEKAKALRAGAKEWPVRFFKSDTTGEKEYEEFYTKDEIVDMDSFVSLGVIDAKVPPMDAVDKLLGKLRAAFEGGGASKEDIVNIMEGYLPNFHHIEKNKSLDSKM